MLRDNIRLWQTTIIWHIRILLLCKNNITRHKRIVVSIQQYLSVQKCEQRSGIYHWLYYNPATQDIEKEGNVIKQYNIIEQ